MQRHQLHAILARLALALARLERGVGKERGEFRQPRFGILGRALEAAGDVDQFVQILDA